MTTQEGYNTHGKFTVFVLTAVYLDYMISIVIVVLVLVMVIGVVIAASRND
jgi:hypothetical protein